jgi:hypothetical protein
MAMPWKEMRPRRAVFETLCPSARGVNQEEGAYPRQRRSVVPTIRISSLNLAAPGQHVRHRNEMCWMLIRLAAGSSTSWLSNGRFLPVPEYGWVSGNKPNQCVVTYRPASSHIAAMASPAAASRQKWQGAYPNLQPTGCYPS